MTSPPTDTGPCRAALGLRPELMPQHLVHHFFARLAACTQQRWRAELGPDGPALHRWQVLSILDAIDGQRPARLTRLTGIEPAVLARVVVEMERDGLIDRRPTGHDDVDYEGDGSLWLTKLGRATFADLAPRSVAFVDRTLAPLTAAEVATLHELLGRLLAATHPATEPAAGTG